MKKQNAPCIKQGYNSMNKVDILLEQENVITIFPNENMVIKKYEAVISNKGERLNVHKGDPVYSVLLIYEDNDDIGKKITNVHQSIGVFQNLNEAAEFSSIVNKLIHLKKCTNNIKIKLCNGIKKSFLSPFNDKSIKPIAVRINKLTVK